MNAVELSIYLDVTPQTMCAAEESFTGSKMATSAVVTGWFWEQNYMLTNAQDFSSGAGAGVDNHLYDVM